MCKNTLVIFFALITCVCFSQDELLKIDALLRDSRYQDAIQLIDGSIGQSKNPTLLNIKRTEALIRLGKLEDAEALLNKLKGEEGKNLFYKALIEMNYGALYQNQGRNDLAIEELQKALNDLEQDNNSTSLEAAEALAYLGNVYRSIGKYVQAEEQLQHALAIREEKLPETHELIAASFNDLGLVYTQLDIDKAFEYYEKALEMYQKLHGNDHPKIAIANTNLGYLYHAEKLYGDAVNNYESALKIWEKIYSQPHPNKALVLMNLGQTYSSMGDQKAALAFYEKARTMYESSQGKKHPDLAYVYNLLGNELKAQHKFDEAIINYQKALIANIPNFDNEDVSVNPRINIYYNGTQLLYSLMYKAQALEAKYHGATLKDSDLVAGIKALQVADSLIDKLRQQTTNESDKIMLGSIANEVYGDGVRIAYLLSDAGLKNRKAYRELSFYFAEKSKSAVLLEAISDTNAKSFANIPNTVLDEEKNLKAAIALISQKLAQKPSDEEEKYFRETLYTLNKSYQEFTRRIESQYPEYFNLKFNSASPSIVQLQNILPEKTALISYFIDEDENNIENSRLYTFILTNKKFSISNVRLPKEYDKYITGLRNGLYFQEPRTFSLSSRNLSKLLIPKISGSINDLVIIPTGRMGVIPFETLLTKTPKETQTFKEYDYLLNQYSVRYEFSASLVLQKKKEGIDLKISSVMLCAPVSFPEKDNLNDLPGTETEINTIANLFKEKNIGSQVYLKSDANETAIKSNSLKNYSLVHFATHGVVDENSPELSRIYLQNDSESEDGNLFAGEIYNLELNAQLVALSACQTGLGKISKGEGVIGLSRALVYAGAKSIIVSFWSVADESTAALMTDFYKQLLENPSLNYSRDLRQAKLNLMKGQYAAPYYWAPFILIGF
ncbi:MAG TPA: CHAT domain-containing tetratricopeptide repeat protein [Cyclobacteriaceae bacterium]|nr:CHAT domain-containing tetratricopeptide repeat protein [Cyclobacteriaceae bacterium]